MGNDLFGDLAFRPQCRLFAQMSGFTMHRHQNLRAGQLIHPCQVFTSRMARYVDRLIAGGNDLDPAPDQKILDIADGFFIPRNFAGGKHNRITRIKFHCRMVTLGNP